MRVVAIAISILTVSCVLAPLTTGETTQPSFPEAGPSAPPELDLSASWSQMTATPVPTPRYNHAMTYASGPRLGVLFAGFDGADRDDTWTYDASANLWQGPIGGTRPAARYAHVLEYHAASGRAVMFGGRANSGTNYVDTWLFDPVNSTWSNPSPASNPGARRVATSAYEPAAKRVIVFGGWLIGTTYLGDTWAYDVANNSWTNRNPASPPSARSNSAMVYDPVIRRIVLYGGANAGGTLSDTWLYDYTSNSWSNPAPSGAPGPRTNPAMAYDGQSRRVVIFSGSNTNAETWRYDSANNTWSNPNPPLAPPPRILATAVYDLTTRRTVFFGGYDGTTRYGDVWSYDSAANRWQDRAPSPAPRSGAPLTQATPSGPLVMFGGASSTSTSLRDTWLFNASSQKWSNPTPPSYPSARNQHSNAWDPVWKRIVLFGGYDWTNYLADTWLYDLQNNTWTQVFPSSPPGLRYAHRLVYDPAIRKIVLYGGFGSGTYYEDVWTYNVGTNQWSQIAASAPPGRRLAHGFDYHPGLKRIVLFSGANSGGNLPDTWLYDSLNNSWSQLSPSGAPTSRFNHAFTFEPISGKMLLFGGQTSGSSFLDDTWTLDVNSRIWTRLSLTPSPSMRNVPAMMHRDAVTGKVILFGGATSLILGDTWTYRGSAPLPPRVISTSPQNGTTGVAATAPVIVNFDQPMDPSATASSFSIGPGISGSLGVSGSTLTFTHATPFAPLTNFSVIISTAATSQQGDAMMAPYSFYFWTGAAPKVIANSPLDGATGLPRWTNVTVTFDMIMDPSATSSSFSISPPISGGSATVSGAVLTWTHSSLLDPNTTYTVTVSTAARSLTGFYLAAPHSFSFSTAQVPPRVLSTSPVDGAVNVSSMQTIQVNFDMAMEPASTSAAFSISPPVTNATVSSTGSILRLTHSSAFTPGTTYTVTVSSTAKSAFGGNLAAAYVFSFTTGLSPQVLKTNPAESETRVYLDRSVSVEFDQSMDPTTTAAAFSISPSVSGTTVSVSGRTLTMTHTGKFSPLTTYAVRLNSTALSFLGYPMGSVFGFVFQTAGPPVVVTTSPANSQTNVLRNSSVTVKFDYPMDPSTTASSFSISPAVAGGSLTVSGDTLTFDHLERFLPDIIYTATISTKATSLAGLSMSAPHSFNFLTSSRRPPVVLLTQPTDGSTGVDALADVIVKFDQSMDPAYTVPAFSIQPPVSGSNVIVIGDILRFTHSLEFQAYTIYTVKVAKTVRTMQGDQMAADHGFIFATGQVLVPPRILTTDPRNDQVGVPINAEIVVTFDQEMDPVSQGAFTIDPPVPGGKVSVVGSQLRFTHSTDFAMNAFYSVTVTTDARSLAGARLSSPHVFRFVTGEDRLAIPPTVAVLPADGSVDVSVDVGLVLTFSEAMDKTSAESAISISPSVSLSFRWNPVGTVVTATPESPLEYDTSYVIQVSVAARSADGANLASRFSSGFTTESAPPVTTDQYGSWLVFGLLFISLLVSAAAVAVALLWRRRARHVMESPFAPMAPPLGVARPATPPPPAPAYGPPPPHASYPQVPGPPRNFVVPPPPPLAPAAPSPYPEAPPAPADPGAALPAADVERDENAPLQDARTQPRRVSNQRRIPGP